MITREVTKEFVLFEKNMAILAAKGYVKIDWTSFDGTKIKHNLLAKCITGGIACANSRRYDVLNEVYLDIVFFSFRNGQVTKMTSSLETDTSLRLIDERHPFIDGIFNLQKILLRINDQGEVYSMDGSYEFEAIHVMQQFTRGLPVTWSLPQASKVPDPMSALI